ncbi:OTU domain-containing protein 3 isoform X2 [Phodopus roborovskii]|uniref:OTU domain-containing protein 3 isoform X2 n=1 Tax=Phodopus roborovskii TaxID=109678 RepID=UPI0021E37B61|nr:OTU domain-containing protein 3 isoform X2 [Phodopus roborovskii]
MSRKQAARSRPGSGGRRAEAERKRDERAARRALAKERRNRPEPGGSAGEEEFVSFANQLQALGLKLREVPGDGNCLFRALGDQLEGHSRNHLKHRQETVDFMIRQREDFEPFVEDDIPFEKHVASLSKPGTFAGNDAIVAFARRHQLNVVIHQLNAPLWQIRGTDKSSVRELHIAYRYGEHYDSVRRINDNSEAPAHLQTDDFNLIVQNLEAENYNIESAIIAMLQMNQGKGNNAKENLEPSDQVSKQCDPSSDEAGSGSTLIGNQGGNEGQIENSKARARPSEENKANKNQIPKVTNKQRREQQRLEKKKRQEERHRHRALESRGSHRDASRSEADVNTQVTLVKTFAALNI